MSRIHLPASPEDAPEASRALLTSGRKALGSVPNLFLITANSPAALEGYLRLSGALGKGRFDARTRERIALAVAEVNGCDYCLSAHSYLAETVAKLDAAETVGFSEAEIIAHVALNALTNDLNETLDTPIDSPVVEARAA